VKLIQHFNDFLSNTVNLNQTRIDTLEARVETIKSFLRESNYQPKITRFSAQGSWAHKTIIKPPIRNKEFDADLVIFVDVVDEWSASDYIVELKRIFRESAVYRDKTSMKSRCVTIDYAEDFHLDVVPIVVENGNSDNPNYKVCNRNENTFETTDGDGFANWWRGQDQITTNHRLIKATRLLKYLRDTKGTFSAKSILLTTLVGQRVSILDHGGSTGLFSDVPTALKTVFNRLDDWLQSEPNMPEVENPALAGEDFTRNWDQDKYDNFRNSINRYREWIDEAFDESERDESMRKWRRVFGDSFAQGETAERATTALTKLAESVDRGKDLVAVVLSHGRNVLARIPSTLPHVKPVTYRYAGRQSGVGVVAYEKRTKKSVRLGIVHSGTPVDKGSGLEFQALQSSGLPIPNTYKVLWQVVNTDREAAANDCLRGGFYNSDTHGYRYEETSYRGVHWVQAFVVNKRTQMIEGVSERFFVVIQ